MEEPSEQGIANGRRTSITATLALNHDPLVRGTWEETAPMRKGKIDAAEATLDKMIYMMGDSPPQVRSEIPVCMKRKETKDKISEPVTPPALALDYLQSSQLDDETDSNSVMTSEGIDDESESAVKSSDATEAETSGAIAEEISANELQQLDFQYSPLHTNKEISPDGGSLSVDECSLAIPPKSLVDNRNLGMFMSMAFKNLGLPANRIPVSPYIDIKFNGELRIPAKARLPTWFKPSKNSKHGIKIYKRYRVAVGENKFAWRELQNEVTVHDGMIEFEVDHFCGFIAMIQDLSNWVRGEIRLSHGLFHLGNNFLSVVCYQSPRSLFQQIVASLEENAYKEIYRNRFVMESTLKVPIRMECFDDHLHEFKPQQYILSPSDIRKNESIRFPFLLHHLEEPQEVVKIKYIVNDFMVPFEVRLFDTKDIQRRSEPRDSNEGSSTQTTFSASSSLDPCTVNVSDMVKLSHGLFQCGEHFLSVVCYHSPKSLYQQIVASLKEIGFKEIYRDNFTMDANQAVTIRMECFDEDLHDFEPQQYLLPLSDIKAERTARFPFLLRHLKEPKEEVDIRYIVDGFPAPLAITLPATKDIQNEGMSSNAEVKSCTDRSDINMDGLDVAISTAISEGILDSDKQQLELRRHPRNAEMEIGPEGGKLSLDECSFTVRPGAIALQSLDECSFTIPPDSNSLIHYEKGNDQSESELIAVKSNEAETAGGIAGEIPDIELPQLGFRHSPAHTDKEVGPKGEKLSQDECSLATLSKSLVDTQNLSALQSRPVGESAIPSKSLVDARNLCISVSTDFQKLALPANKMPVSPYFGVNFDGKLSIPAEVALPTWFKALNDSNHGIKIYKRYRDDENKFVWQELQNEVKVHDDVIKFEVDHCCGFLAMILNFKDRICGVINLSHGLFQSKRNFRSVVCYRSPKSLFQEVDSDFKGRGFEKIYYDHFKVNTNQEFPIRMECIDVDLPEFRPPEYLFNPSGLTTGDFKKLPFVMQELVEPKDDIDINYVVADFTAPLAVTLPATKGNITHEGSRKTINAMKMADNGSTFTATEHDAKSTLAVQTPSGDTSTEAPQRQQPGLMRVTTEFEGAATIQNLHLLGTGNTHDHRQYPRIHIHGGVLLFCGISILFLGFFLALGLFYGMSPRFLQSYSTGHDEI